MRVHDARVIIEERHVVQKVDIIEWSLNVTAAKVFVIRRHIVLVDLLIQ